MKPLARKFRCNKTIYLIIFVLITLQLALVMHLPITVRGDAGHDDGWFISNAINILRGNWLGSFNQMTLIKGVGYPIFLAFNFILGTPITLTTTVLNIFSCIFFVYVLKELGLPKLFSLCLLVFLLFQPALLPMYVIRDNFNTSLSLIAISGFIYSSLHKIEKCNFFIVGISGLILGFFWVTREESIWVIPSFCVISFYSLLKSSNKKALFLRIKLMAIYILMSILFPLGVGLINQNMYGVFQTVDIKSRSFTNALNALNSVDVGNETQFLSVSNEKRQAIYKISPTFKKLEPYFEDINNGWKIPGCNQYPHTCGDYASGWFMWAIRDGVNNLGHYKTAEDAASFYEQITFEIINACKYKRISCVNNPLPLMPRLSEKAIESIPKKLVEAIELTLYKTTLGSTNISSSDYKLNNIMEFIGYPRIFEPIKPKTLKIAGWYYSHDNDWVSLECDSENEFMQNSISRLSSPDIAKAFNDIRATNQRFSISENNFESCSVSFVNSKIKLNRILETKINHYEKNGHELHFDVIEINDPNAIKENFATSVKKNIVNIYRSFSIYLYIAGTILFLLACLITFKKRLKPKNLLVIALFLWILYYSRIALIVMVDISSFPGITYLYLMPIFNLWFAASFVSVSAFSETFKLIKHI